MRGITVILFIIAFAVCMEKPARLSSYRKKIGVKQFKKLKARKRFVFALFNNPKTKKGKRLKGVLKAVFKSIRDIEIAFVHIPMKKKTVRLYEFFLYVNDSKKKYEGLKSFKAIKKWILSVYKAEPQQYRNLRDIPLSHNHYFVYAGSKYYSENMDKTSDLAKLVYPIPFVYGLMPDQLDRIFKRKQDHADHLWVYRQYKKKIIKIDGTKDLYSLSIFIKRSMYSDLMIPNGSSIKLLLKLRKPFMLFFYDKKDDEELKMLIRLCRRFKDDFLLMAVNVKAKDKYTRYLVDMLGVRKYPALRLINMVDTLHRFEYEGELSEEGIQSFITRYINGDLKSYTLNEHFSRTKLKNGITKGNYQMFKNSLNDNRNYLIYVYGRFSSNLNEDFEVLQKIKEIVKEEENISLMVINHDKNDLDGHYNDKMPFLILINSKNKLVYYEDEIVYGNVVKFIKKEIPGSLTKKPVLSTDL